VNHDPRLADPDRPQEPDFRLPWLIAPVVATLVVLLVVGVASLLWPRETAQLRGSTHSPVVSSTAP
jgi:hypothetical protein